MTPYVPPRRFAVIPKENANLPKDERELAQLSLDKLARDAID
jgi:hypothetical protein